MMFSKANGKRRRRIRKLRLFTLILLVGLFCFASFAYGVVFGIRSELPQLDQTRKHRIEADGLIYASDGHTVLARLVGDQSRKLVESKDIPPVMKQAIVAIEDKRFFEHQGLDLHGILRALWQDLTNKEIVQGGSTITQQFVKNAYVTSKRSISRKLKEAMLAWQLEQRARHDKAHGKDWILTQYLNTIYFGNGAYGIERAAQVYFDHRAKTLTLAEAALLAGIPADPSLYNPVANPQAARARRHAVLQAMLDQRDITYPEYRTANRTPLPKPDDIHQPGLRGPAQYFVDYVKQQLVDHYGTRKVFGGGLRVVTTIDLELQRRAREAIAKWLPGPGPSAALVAIDPRDGRVLSMVGGSNYRESQFNLAVQGERQAGSAFKPFVLATALEQGISPTTVLESKPVTIALGDRDWYVQNYEGSNLGAIDLVNATVYSDNTVYAQLTHIVGPAAVAKEARDLGITRELNPYFAIGLGADPVSPLEMARAYASFATGGQRIDGSIFENRPRVVLSVSGVKNQPVRHRAISETNARIVNSILQQVVQSGTGKRAALPDGRAVAGKTGTTENYGDAWFVGYTPQLVVAVWVGYPTELRPMLTEYHGDPVAGGTYPALIWKSFMESALPYLDDAPQSFPAPDAPPGEPRRLVLRDGSFQLDNGLCRNTIQVAYFAGQTPPKKADCKPNEVEIPNVVGATYGAARARLEEQPLTPVVVYKPAVAGQRLNVVVKQIPPRGRVSSFDKVTIVFAKPLHGVVPKLVGLPVTQAQTKLEQLKLRPVFRGRGDEIVRQRPAPGVAAGPGLPITLWVRPG
ncbi:MAG TPA: PBP1A family penicillin-binding protein [Gaiellaceae bacterium]|nr:PBP1A family penicillin-binding protein [Gaiellaceae bacterium]